MGLIKNRIIAEYRKHKYMDWERLAEQKIIANLEYLFKEFDFNEYAEPSTGETDTDFDGGAYLCKEELIKALMLKIHGVKEEWDITNIKFNLLFFYFDGEKHWDKAIPMASCWTFAGSNPAAVIGLGIHR